MIIVNSIFPVLYGTPDFIKMHLVSSVWADLPAVCDSICAQFVSSVRADLLLLDLLSLVKMTTNIHQETTGSWLELVQHLLIFLPASVRSEDQFILNVQGSPIPADSCYSSPEYLSQLKDLKEDIQ